MWSNIHLLFILRQSFAVGWGETPEGPGYVKLSNENFVLEVTNPAIFWREKDVLEWNPIN